MKGRRSIIKEFRILPQKMFYLFFKRDEMIPYMDAAQRLYEYLDRESSQADYDKIKMH